MDFDDLSYSTAEELSTGKNKRAKDRNRKLAERAEHNDKVKPIRNQRESSTATINYNRIKRLSDVMDD